jgi:WD40 repeat protein
MVGEEKRPSFTDNRDSKTKNANLLDDAQKQVNAAKENDDEDLAAVIQATMLLHEKQEAFIDLYSNLRNEREKATFSMMMRMNPAALTAIRKEWFCREDSVVLDEFIYIIQKHLMPRNKNVSDIEHYSFTSTEQREFGSNMFELFKDIDVNGDGDLEWQEFTSFTVEKANILTQRLKLASIAHYYESTSTLDPSADYRHRHDISSFCKISSLGQFAFAEDHKNAIFLFNSRAGKLVKTIQTDSAPIALEHIKENDTLVASCSDMTMSTYSLNHSNPNKKYLQLNTWATPGVQMAITYMPDNQILYSGATNGNVYSWKIKERSLISTFSGHSDIVMGLCGLKNLNNVASCSLDKTISVWDSYTNAQILKLIGHKKGVLGMTYSPEYRLLISCGFEHDACIWSPFVKNLVYRLKGHHASLVGVETVDGAPEIITADITGVFKLWDIRNYQCVQTFIQTSNTDMSGAKLSTFFHTKLPPRSVFQKEDDSRIYCASKNIFSFDQTRVVHGATTDFTNTHWVAWNDESLVFCTASERNIIIWDALTGSKTVTSSNISGDEISACCFDDRKRKILIGDVHGNIGVYNHLNGTKMKTVQNYDNPYTVVALEYVDETRRFICGFSNGIIRIYDENSMDDCACMRTFDSFNAHPELLTLSFNPADKTVATAGASSCIARLWDYSAGKCEFDLQACDSSESIVSLTYFLPYPIIATSDSRGNVILWASRLAQYAATRLGGFINVNPPNCKTEKRKKVSDGDEEPPTRTLPVDEIIYDLSYLDIEEDEDDDPEPVYETTDLSKSKTSKKKKDEDDDIEESVEAKLSAKQAKELFEKSEDIFGKVTAANAMSFDPDSFLMFTADDGGNLRCFSIKNLIMDLGGARLLKKQGGEGVFSGKVRELARTDSSALPPVTEKLYTYTLAHRHDAMCYHGIDFKWCVTAHEDRIITCRATPNGVLTSGADMLVKMWTFTGEPIGVLLQSVPAGTRSRSWKLNLDIEGIMAQEEIVLGELLEDVIKLAAQDDLPDIEDYDFEGMEPGINSAEFSRSELRQRIEKSSINLGIDFPTESEVLRRQNEGLSDEISLSESSGLKSMNDALKELKSADNPANPNQKVLSENQLRYRKAKLEDVAKKYEDKSGVKIEIKQQTLDPMAPVKKFEKSKTKRSHSSQVTQEDNNSLSDSSNKSVASVKSYVKNEPRVIRINKDKPNLTTTKLEASGWRADLTKDICKRFNTFSGLDNALKNSDGVFSKEEIEKVKKIKEEREIKLRKDKINREEALQEDKDRVQKQLEMDLAAQLEANAEVDIDRTEVVVEEDYE